MNLKVNINTDRNCRITTTDNTIYPAEDTVSHVPGEFKYSESISIVAIHHNKIKEENAKYKIQYIPHSTNRTIDIPINLDGWFDVFYIVLPTLEWVQKEAAITGSSHLSSYDIIYCSDGVNLFQYSNKKFSTVDSINTIINSTESNLKTTVSLIKQEYVSICYLRKCYISLCKQIFESRGLSPCWSKNNIDSELVYKRDLVWMAINVITYLTEIHSECHPTLAEVERIIEMIHGCNGVCKPPTMLNTFKGSNDCGCGM